jgi:MFS family permease
MATIGSDADRVIPLKVQPADAPIGWLAICALMSAAYYPVLGLYGFGVALPVIAHAFAGQPNVTLLSQLIGSVVGFAFAVGSPIVGRLVDRFGYRLVMMASAAAFGVIGSAGGLCDNLYLILATRVLLGFTVAGALVAGLAGIGALPPVQRVKIYGWLAVIGGVMAIIFYALVGLCASIGWRWPFALHLVAFALLPVYRALPKPIAPTHAAEEAEAGARLPLAMLLVAMFMGMAGIVGPLFAPFFLVDIGITSPAAQSIPLVAMGAAAILASAVFGRINGRLGIDGTFSFALAAMGVGLLVAGQSHSLLLISIALAITAVGANTYSPNLNAAVVAICGSARGRALGMASAAMYGAQSVFPFVAQLINRLAGPAAVFRLFGLVALLIAIGFAVTARKGRKA